MITQVINNSNKFPSTHQNKLVIKCFKKNNKLCEMHLLIFISLVSSPHFVFGQVFENNVDLSYPEAANYAGKLTQFLAY